MTSWQVRAATPADIEAVRAVAAEGWRDTYDGLLQAETIEAFVERAYAPERVERRIGSDTFLLAIEGERVVAFADAREDEEQVHLLAIYALPSARGRGAGSALLSAIVDRFPGRPIVAEVLIGNRKGEVFYEARGFEPAETIEQDLFGEPVAERRWWLMPEGSGGQVTPIETCGTRALPPRPPRPPGSAAGRRDPLRRRARF